MSKVLEMKLFNHHVVSIEQVIGNGRAIISGLIAFFYLSLFFKLLFSVSDWLTENGLSENFEQLDKTELNNMLRYFYSEVRTLKGEKYSKSSLICLRAGIFRHLNTPPYSKNVSHTNADFTSSNAVFVAVLKDLKKSGKDQATHWPPISELDLQILQRPSSFNQDDPRSLLYKVWWDIHYNFLRRGCQNDRELSTDSFDLKRDSSGKLYLQLSHNELTKNHQGGAKKDVDVSRTPRMYQNVHNPATCPIRSYIKYMSKRNQNQVALWQKPKKFPAANPNEPWYDNVAVGKGMLATFMSKISQKLNLSQIYKNHSIRSTGITTLFHAGVNTHHICNISGHNNPSSLMHYVQDSSEAQKVRFSALLQNSQMPPSVSNNTATDNCIPHHIPPSATTVNDFLQQMPQSSPRQLIPSSYDESIRRDQIQNPHSATTDSTSTFIPAPAVVSNATTLPTICFQPQSTTTFASTSTPIHANHFLPQATTSTSTAMHANHFLPQTTTSTSTAMHANHFLPQTTATFASTSTAMHANSFQQPQTTNNFQPQTFQQHPQPDQHPISNSQVQNHFQNLQKKTDSSTINYFYVQPGSTLSITNNYYHHANSNQ